MRPDPRRANNPPPVNDPSMPVSNIRIMASLAVKLKFAKERGDGLAIDANEVKALVFMLRTLRDGARERRDVGP